MFKSVSGFFVIAALMIGFYLPACAEEKSSMNKDGQITLNTADSEEDPPLPSILSDLVNEAKTQTLTSLTPEFQRRLELRYPIGSSAKHLVDDLTSQGFTGKQVNSYPHQLVFLMVKNGHAYSPPHRKDDWRMGCSFWWQVNWNENDKGNIVDLKGSLGSGCS